MPKPEQSNLAIPTSMDLFAQKARTGSVPTTGPGYGVPTSPQPIGDKPIQGGPWHGVDPRELDPFRAVMDPDQFDLLLRRITAAGKITPIPFNVDAVTASQVIGEQTDRRWLFILNRHATNNILVGFGWVPTAGNAFEIQSGLGFFESTRWCPTDSISIIGSGGAANGLVLVAT